MIDLTKLDDILGRGDPDEIADLENNFVNAGCDRAEVRAVLEGRRWEVLKRDALLKQFELLPARAQDLIRDLMPTKDDGLLNLMNELASKCFAGQISLEECSRWSEEANQHSPRDQRELMDELKRRFPEADIQ